MKCSDLVSLSWE